MRVHPNLTNAKYDPERILRAKTPPRGSNAHKAATGVYHEEVSVKTAWETILISENDADQDVDVKAERDSDRPDTKGAGLQDEPHQELVVSTLRDIMAT